MFSDACSLITIMISDLTLRPKTPWWVLIIKKTPIWCRNGISFHKLCNIATLSCRLPLPLSFNSSFILELYKCLLCRAALCTDGQTWATRMNRRRQWSIKHLLDALSDRPNFFFRMHVELHKMHLHDRTDTDDVVVIKENHVSTSAVMCWVSACLQIRDEAPELRK